MALASEAANLSPDIREFCQREGVAQYLPVALQVMRRHFGTDRSIQAELYRDPDDGVESVFLTARVEGEPGDIADRYQACVRDWMEAVPWPANDRIHIDFRLQ